MCKKIKAARGIVKADIVLKNGTVLNVFTEELIKADVAISGDTIVGVGKYSGEKEIDCGGKYITPGFIDGHMHIETTMASPLEFAKYAVKKGTTTIIADPHEIVNVAGKKGMDFMLDATENIPINAYIMVPSCVPASDIDVNGAGNFTVSDMSAYKNHPRVLGFGEMMRFEDVLDEKKEAMEKIAAFKDMIMDGHAPGISGKDVQAYALAGITSDHECETPQEALEKLRAGFYVLLREGSGARNVEPLLKGLLKEGVSLENCLFCTDDKHLEDIEKEGHINYCVRKAISMGVPVSKAYKMASINTARAYGLKKIGAVAPGYLADILIMDSLADAEPKCVIKSGKIADYKLLSSYSYEIKDVSLLKTVKCKNLTKDRIVLNKLDKNHVIEAVPNQLLTLHKMEEIPGENGIFIPDKNYTKLCVVERYGKTGNVSVCPMKGYGIQNGAVATSVSHDSHNIIAAGDNDDDIVLAVNELIKINGGYVIASKGKVTNKLPLEIGGLMSTEKGEKVQKTVSEMVAEARKMGVPEGIEPFISLSFMALTAIPEIRLTEGGLYDVINKSFV